jgi:DNA end-binding protein Ku
MPRPMWSGAISFGLVNIPVKLYKATASSSGKSISFHQIHKPCGTRIKHIRWCPKDEVEVPWDEVAKGYEFEKGKYVEVTDEELDELLPEEDFATINIESFVDVDEVDPIFYDRAYYIGPDAANKPYALLHEALKETGKIAVARVLLRTRSHLALVRVLDDHLLLETMYFPAEIVKADDIPGAGKANVDKKQAEMAKQLIASMTSKWNPEKYKDEYAAKVKHVIEQKIEGGEVVESLAPAEDEGGGKVVNLLEALRRSVAATQHPEKPAADDEKKTAHPKHAAHKARGSRRQARARTRRRAS